MHSQDRPRPPLGVIPPCRPGDSRRDVAFGAQPGNVIGTGSPLPTSDHASEIMEANQLSCIAPHLPPPWAASDTPHDLLNAAAHTLDAGHTGKAQEAPERAETRLLSCCVTPVHIGQPNTDHSIARIGEARQLHARGDVARAANLRRAAVPSDTTDEDG
jgi:hypothetical protein